MEGPLQRMSRPFHERTRIGRFRAGVSIAYARSHLTIALAAAFPLLLLAGILADPTRIGLVATHAPNVLEVFSRLISAMTTTATIAVSVATLTLGRSLRGLEGQQEHHRTNEHFREGVRRRGRLTSVPMALGGFIAQATRLAAQAATEARLRAKPEDLDHRAEGVRLGDYLEFVERGARLAADEMDANRRDPARLMVAVLDFEQESTHHIARLFARDDSLDGVMQAAMKELSEALKDVVVTGRYLKTLDIQWGLSHMSTAILMTSLPAVFVSIGMTLLYNERVVAALGIPFAGILVCAALTVVLLPLAAFVSYLLRFVFINRYTLPTADFVLGPEHPDVVEDLIPSGRDPARRTDQE